MLSNMDLVKKVFSQIESGKVKEAGEFLSDDFWFKGPSLMTLNKRQYLEAHEALVNALPDWKFNATGWQEEGDVVKMKVRITGTHTRPLNYPFPGIQPGSPTNNRISLPDEPTQVTVRSGKIVSIEADTVPGGGIRGVFEQLGIKPPVPVGAI